MSDSVRPHSRQPTRLPHPWDSPGKNTGVGCHFLLQCMKVKSEREVAQSCLTLCDPMDYSLPRLLSPWDFPGKCTGVGCHCLLRPSRSVVCNSCNPMDCNPPVPSDYGIFQARILNGVVISFSRGSFQPRDWSCISSVSCIAGIFFTQACLWILSKW